MSSKATGGPRTRREQQIPPRVATGLLRRSLRGHVAGDAIAGDLLEDFHQVHRDSGTARAQLFYWREALGLAVTFFTHRLASALASRLPSSKSNTIEVKSMIEALAPKGLFQDAGYALKSIRHDIGLLLFALVIVGVGVGATTAVFSVMSPLMIEPLPFQDSERLAWIANSGDGGRSGVTSRTSNLRDFREQASSFTDIAGYNAFFEQNSYNLVDDGKPERLSAVGVTWNFLEVLGVEPLLGRNFTETEGTRWDDSSILLSHGLWQERFAGDRNIVGSAVTINGSPSSIIGVLPADFDFSSIFTPNVEVNFLTNFPVDERTDRWGNTVSMVGRLAPGVSVETAQAELDNILERLSAEDPDRWGLGARVSSLQGQISGPFRSGLLLLFGAAAAVMLIVCVNLCSLLLSKGINRRNEMSLRSALGAPRGRLLRQMLFESLLLAGGGSALGVLIATVVTRFIASSHSIAIPMLRDVQVDGRALLFTVLTAMTAGIAVGLLPALQASKAGRASALRGAGRSISADRSSRWVREGLVVVEVAMACALLVIGGLLLRSYSNVLDVDLGFETDNTVAWLINTEREFDEIEPRANFYRQIAEEVSAVPGVTAVGFADAIPLGINRQWGLRAPSSAIDPEESIDVFPHIIDQGYLAAMQIPLLDGRYFHEGDTQGSERVAILNESLATELFPEGDAVGKTIRLNSEAKVVGVVADIRHVALEAGSGRQLYLYMQQTGDYNTLDLVVRSNLPLSEIEAPVESALHRVDPLMPADDVRTLGSVVDNAVSPRRFTLRVLGGFAATALLLAALGIYGVLSYTVSERKREISIRMALGESSGRVRSKVLVRTLVLSSLGVTLGIAAALGTSRLLQGFLFDIEPSDPVTLASMAVLLISVSALSGFLPAVRASKTDALAILRSS